MLSRLKRCGTGRTTAAGLVLAAALSFALPCVATAQCSLDNSGYVFLHPWFSGKRWAASLQDMRLSIDPELCEGFSPLQVSFTGRADRAAAVMSTATGLFLVTTSSIDDQCLCCRYTIEFSAPRSLSPGAGVYQTGGPLHALKRNSVDTVIAVVARQAGAVSVMRIRTTSMAVLDAEAVILTPRPYSQQVRWIGGDQGPDGFDRGVWIVGTRGLIRYLPFQGTIRGTESSFDIDSAETVLCVGGGFAGTESGRIFRRNNAAFTPTTTTASAPVRAIDSATAVGDNGTVLIRSGTGWTAYRHTTSGYRRFNRIAAPGGQAVELLGSSWGYGLFEFRDSLTSIKSITPASFSGSVNGSVFEYPAAGPVNIAIALRDIDSNYQAPLVTLRRAGQAISLNSDGNAVLTRAEPGAQCAAGKVLFADSLVQITLSVTGVEYTARCRRALMDVNCNTCAWIDYVFRRSEGWAIGDTLIIAVGRDTVRIRNGQPAVGATMHRGVRGGNSVRLLLGDGTSPATIPVSCAVRAISFYDGMGRQIARVENIRSGDAVTVPSSVRRAIAVVVVEYMDGTRRGLTVPVLR